MPDTPRPQPAATPRAEAEAAARKAREGAALRENLRRRKEQARAREADDSTEGDGKE
jgi:hypothetical protein